jgi:hypothetical protein
MTGVEEPLEATQLFTNLAHYRYFRGLTRMTPTSGQPELPSSTCGGPDPIPSRDDDVRRGALGTDDPRRSFSEDDPARPDHLHLSARRTDAERPVPDLAAIVARDFSADWLDAFGYHMAREALLGPGDLSR